MGILSRFAMIMKANINHIIDTTKHPEKVIQTTVKEVTLDLRTIQSEANAAKANERRAKQALDECKIEIKKMERFSKKATENKDEQKASIFLEQIKELQNKQEVLTDKYNKAVTETKQLKLLEEKRALDLAQLEKRNASLKEKASSLKQQTLINNGTSFDEYEAQLNHKLDEATALAELRGHSKNAGTTLDEEIAALKKKRETNY